MAPEPHRLKAFTARADDPALRDTAIWLGLLLGTGAPGVATWAVPVFVVYGVLYAIADSRWHDCGHGTAIHAFAGVAALWSWSLLPLMLVGLPRFYGVWLSFVMGVPQHLGLAEDVLDHRLNSRTIRMNFVLRFFYWNMNYHIEHHTSPSCSTTAWPTRTRRSSTIVRRPNSSLWAVWRDMIPCVLRQLRNPLHFVRPDGAGRRPDRPAAAA